MHTDERGFHLMEFIEEKDGYFKIVKIEDQYPQVHCEPVDRLFEGKGCEQDRTLYLFEENS